ncbi:hypothetical protein M9H77_22296 [Catharanthus roseus]|uniref:Uncharacterized protein n=1 Tax=Catharanthus roseus TaxID=4058 RepID=A0ACC0ASN4_CATRO|nr:hypothetical protein M9H77_22296 [Catharanthus roseus]
MCMGSDLLHDQDEDGMGVKGKRPIKGFVGQCSGKKQEVVQKDLTKRHSRSKYIEELHKHQKGEKKGEYEKFQEIQRKAEEDAEASSNIVPDDLQLMAIVAGGVNRSYLYGAGFKAAHFMRAAEPHLHHVAWIRSRGLCRGLRMLFREYLLPSTSTYGGYSSIIN